MAYRDGDSIMNSRLRTALFVSRLLHWASAVIVMGLASYFISTFSHHEHIIYEEVIACIATAFILIAMFFSFVRRATWHLTPLDLIFSYLWLVAVVFTTQDYNFNDCTVGPPEDSDSCSRKHALEAFTFIAFFMSLISAMVQHTVWTDERVIARHDDEGHEKVDPTRSDVAGGTGPAHNGV